MARRTVSEHHARLIADTAKYEAGMARAVAATKAAESKIGSSGRGMGATFQNVGFQVQDFAVQVAGGTSAMRAFGQQAPQMLGAFGPAGAVAGAVVSVGALIAQIVMATKETKAATEQTDKLAEAFERLAKGRRDFAFGNLSPEDQVKDLQKQEERLKGQAEAADRVRRAMIEAMGAAKQMGAYDVTKKGATIAGVPVQDENGQTMRRQQFADWLADQADEAQAKFVAAETERERLARSRQEIEEKIAATIRDSENEAIAAGVKAVSERLKAEFKASEQLEKLDKWRAERAQERMEQAVSDAIQDIYGGARSVAPNQGPLMPEIPANSYQRRGLSLDADGGASAAMQKQDRQIDLLESIDGTLKAARRSGIITWQTN
jgi:hypothetical protein